MHLRSRATSVAFACLWVCSRVAVSVASAAHGGYRYERGGVLFYAGFNGTRDAQAIGDGKARLIEGGGTITAAGFDSVRGSALRSGDGLGRLEFSAASNILPDEGTIEIWIRLVSRSGSRWRRRITCSAWACCWTSASGPSGV